MVKPSFVRSELKIKDTYQILNYKKKDTHLWIINDLILHNLFEHKIVEIYYISFLRYEAIYIVKKYFQEI